MDQKQIYELMDRFEKSRLSEISLKTESFKITLKSAPAFDTGPGAQSASAFPGVPHVITEIPARAESSSASDTEIITAPIVGTFYRSPAPDAPAYVDEGSQIATGDSICIIEAMKIMNKLEADFDCQIVKILAENGEMVEFGSPLFEVKRT